MLTFAAPVGLGVLATVGIYSGLTDLKNKEEAAKMSKFLAEIMMAALPSELYLHNRMADKLGISREEVKELRRAINFKHDGELWVVKEVLEANVATTKLLSVREQYRLQPGK